MIRVNNYHYFNCVKHRQAIEDDVDSIEHIFVNTCTMYIICH